MKCAISNIAWTADQDVSVYQLMKQYNYKGLEIAPTRIFPQNPYGCLTEARQWAENLKKQYGFTVCSMQSIWFGRTEKLFGSRQEQEALLTYTKMAVDFAAAIDCKNLVFGCPGNRALPENADVAKWQEGIAFFQAAGAYAEQNQTVIGMEANPPIYNTNYINTTQEALALIRETETAGFGLNLDVGTMVENGERVEILEGNAAYINHVHISEPHLAPIVMSKKRRGLHQELSCFLKENQYQGYISIEMGKTQDLVLLSELLNYIREVFG